jgi:hypothetical protein
MHEQRAEEAHRVVRLGRAVHVGEIAPELQQERERDQDSRERDPCVVEPFVAQARQPERTGDDREQHDCALVRQPLVHEPV